MSGKPLREWQCGSYKEDGRPVSTTSSKEAPKQTPPASHGNGMRSMPKNAADPGRRNK